MVTRYRRPLKYYDDINEAKETGTGHTPLRVNLSVYFDIFRGDVPKGQVIALEEINAIRSERSYTSAAIKERREQFESCIMLRGSPLDNKWSVVFALHQMVEAHNIQFKQEMI